MAPPATPMRAITTIPEAQLAPLLDAYAASVAARRRQTWIGLAILALATGIAAYGAEVNLPMFWNKLGNFTSYFGRLAHLDDGGLVWTAPRDWFWGLRRWSIQLAETILIAYVGTLTGAVLAFLGSFSAAANLVETAWLRLAVRRFFEFLRTVPDLVFAMIFVVAFGLGALPGALAIALHTTGTLGKLFTEVAESIAMGPVEGITATGGSWFARVRYGAMPQVLSNFASYTLLRFEINVRGATIIGFVGAGGIGQELLVAIRKFYYSDVSAILVMIIVTVMLLDMVSARLRHALLTSDGSR